LSGLLLGTRALKEMISGSAASSGWLEAQGDVPLHASLASVALLLASAEAMTNVTRRRAWVEKLSEDIPASFGPRLLGFDLAAAKQWSAIRAGFGADDTFEECDLFVVAAALAENLEYVAPREAWHVRISGLRQHDPWASKTYPS
jgi:hypothetical protein